MQAQCPIQEIPHYIRDDDFYSGRRDVFYSKTIVILNAVKDLPIHAPCHIQEIPRYTRDDG
ncbi:hypothetical protein [Legionella quateirensis]|uniref:hypothetical protein n=1 Tax=Legionella quateirensis TaxID=45072 RepID=UPI000730BFD1|nr:hypothetical protein [Legionella quateirensis]